MLIENDIRGGVSQCSNRYAKVNHKYMNEQYDSNLPNSYLIYFDINYMDGAAMRHYLVYGEFEWIVNINIYIFVKY